MFFVKKMVGQSLFSSTNLQPYTFWERFSHAHVNESDDWGAPKSLQNIWINFQEMDLHGKAQVID